MSTLRANTLKPITSGNSLVLQGDSGGSGVSGPSIDSNGDVDFSQNTDAKVKLPSGGGIYESDGSTPILTESGGSVSLQNVVLGSTVSGQGLTGGMELWRLNTNITNDDNPLGNSGGEWTIGTGNQSNTGVDTYGTGLVSESNGTWTINENGYFLITINLLALRNNNVHGKIDIQSSDVSGSGYTVISKAYALTQGPGQDEGNCNVQALIKVTGSSPFNHKYIRFGYDTNDALMIAQGSANENLTYAIFHKISDV